ncbi:LOW QUALITY PROTEIN: integral membrane transporter, partial [Streptomyces lividans TK24]
MSTSPPVRAPETGGGNTPDARQLRAILIAVSVALMAVVASVSGLNVAQTHMAVEFGASQSTVLWIINIYTLALAALLLPLGAVGDRLGRRPMLVAGLGVFGAASVLAGLAPSAEVMLAARVAGGAGAAMIMPVTLAVITSTFPEEQRGKAIGVWTGVAGGGGILGMFLSALLVDVADWRLLFVLPVVLVLVALAMALKSVPDSRETAAHRFDTVGALISTVAVTGLIFVLQEGPERGWTDPVTLTGLVAGITAAVGFVAWELRRRDAALLDVRLFRERGLAGGSITLLVVFGVQAGIAVVLFPYFQAVLGWSGLLSTVALMPMAVMMMATSGLAPMLAARVGSRATMAAGIALAGVGPRAHGPVRLRGRRIPDHPARHAGHGHRHGPVDDPVHRGHHRLPAAREAGRRVRTQRRHPRVRHRTRCRPARGPAGGRLPRCHRRTAGRHPPGPRGRGPPGCGQRGRGRGRRRTARPGPAARRPAVLRRRLAAGHVGGRRRHGRPVRLRGVARAGEDGPRGRGRTGGRRGPHRPL